MVLYQPKADGVDRVQAGDMLEAQDLDIQNICALGWPAPPLSFGFR
jgi:hypothetical protein